MRLLLIYDIAVDRIRTKVATTCEDYGLDRIQYSAFAGELTRNLQEELMMKIGTLLDESPGHIQLIPIMQDGWEKRLEVGNA